MNIQTAVENLIEYAKQKLYLDKRDELYVKNLVLSALDMREPDGKADPALVARLNVPDILLDVIGDYAVEKGLTDEFLRGNFLAKIMGLVTPMPSKVVDLFEDIRTSQGSAAACDFLYKLSIDNNYIQKTAVDKSLYWKAEFEHNYLEITINLSKPEKTNAETAKLLTAPSAGYPKCVICPENIGFEGSLRQNARQNLRFIPVTLAGEEWVVQYSPFVYYNQHCIAISTHHTPMVVNEKSFVKLRDFVDFLPNFFIGSNASLPIIGGSILNHEHYQGGEHLLPMQFAPYRTEYRSDKFKNVKIGEVEWYNSVLRLESEDSEQLIACASEIYNAWQTFDAPEVHVVSHTDKQHNALSPIMRKVGNTYKLDIILRNNCVNEEYPEGIFHAAPQYHNIKKEAIGLIEAMGMFILPGRLKRQTAIVEELLCGKSYDRAALAKTDMECHLDMIDDLLAKFGSNNAPERAHEIMVDRINRTCEAILRCTAVFKPDAAGRAAYEKFVAKLGYKKA